MNDITKDIKKLKWYPFDWDEYSGETFYLTTIQHGIYILFQRHLFSTGESIKHEDRFLISKTGDANTSDVDFILKTFFVRKEEYWVHVRCEELIQKQISKHREKLIAISKAREAKAKRIKLDKESANV